MQNALIEKMSGEANSRRRWMVVVTVRLHEACVEALDELVKAGLYHNRAEAIRDAVLDLIVKNAPITAKVLERRERERRRRVEA